MTEKNNTSPWSYSPEAEAAIEEMKNQLLIVLVARLGGVVDIPADEIDATGGHNLSMLLDEKTRTFCFRVVNKGESS